MMTMMTRRGDLDLNHAAVPGCSDLVKEVLRKAMLQHEVIFKHQVRELHRLYWTQKNLMLELCCKTVTTEDKKGVLVPPSQSKSPMVSSCSLQGGVGQGHGVGGDNGNRLKMFDLRLPADVYIKDAGEKVVEDNWTTAEKRHPVDDRCGRAPEVIDLERSVGIECDENFDGISLPGFKALIESGRGAHDRQLEKPFHLHSSSRAEDDYGCRTPANQSHAALSAEWQERKSSHSAAGFDECSDALSIDLATPKQQSTSCKLLHIDLNTTLGDDLLYPLHDRASMFSSPSTSSSIIHQKGLDESRAAATQIDATMWRESSNVFSKGTSLNSALKCSQDWSIDWVLASEKGKKAAENSWTHSWNEADNTVHGSECVVPEEPCRNPVAGFTSGSRAKISISGELPSLTGLCKVGDMAKDVLLDQEHCHLDSDSRRQASTLTSSSNDIEGNNMHASVLSTNLPTPAKRLEEKQGNREGSEDDTLSSHTIARDEEQNDELFKESPTEEKSNNLNENNECNSQGKSVERHTEDSGTMQLELPMTENSPNKVIPKMENCDRNCLHGKACLNGCTKLQDYIMQQQAQVAELDCVIKIAAETLVYLSLEHVECPLDQLGGSKSIELDADKWSNEPQYSADSFESITLMLSESKIEEFSRLSQPIMKEIGKETCGIRLRRGRGLRDFQKEILPGLVSLSRHEICEDLHYIGYELRKSGLRNRGNWLVPARSRQSKRCLTRRRH